jgi:hypothetical protein
MSQLLLQLSGLPSTGVRQIECPPLRTIRISSRAYFRRFNDLLSSLLSADIVVPSFWPGLGEAQRLGTSERYLGGVADPELPLPDPELPLPREEPDPELPLP